MATPLSYRRGRKTSRPLRRIFAAAVSRLAVALSVSSDALLFDVEERGPDEELRYQFEAIRQFDPPDRKVAKDVLDGLILKHQAKRLVSNS